MLTELELNDVIVMRKSHPCGSNRWNVVRLGADIGLECQGCQHRILMPRRDLSKKMKTLEKQEVHDTSTT